MQAEFRQALERCDVVAVRGMWQRIAPHLPQPTTDEGVMVSIHHARTQANTIMFKLRAYSHRWLTERNLPSGLPDELRPKAERIYPVVVEGVGIAVLSKISVVADGVRRAMSDAVMDAYAEGLREPEFIRQRMMEARDRKRRYFRDLINASAG